MPSPNGRAIIDSRMLLTRSIEVRTEWNKDHECKYDKSLTDPTCRMNGVVCKWATSTESSTTERKDHV